MRLGSFLVEGRPGFGLFSGEQVYDLAPLTALAPARTLREALEHFSAENIGSLALRDGTRRRIEQIVLQPPFPDARRILCVGLNYRSHALEAGGETPDHPSLFIRFPSSFVGSGQSMLMPALSEQFDFEGEVAVVIGKPGFHIAVEYAADHILGYTLAAENSVRDWQKHAGQVTPGKNFLSSGMIGPWCVTRDEIGARPITFSTWLNGIKVQEGDIANMIFSPERLIAYISSFTRLSVGDLILTGTPEGVGLHRKPPLWMKPGDRLELRSEALGDLAGTVAAEDAFQHPAGAV